MDTGLNELDVLQYWRRTGIAGDAILAFVSIDVTVLTWSNTRKGTWAWCQECVDEACAILPPEAKNPNFAPAFNLAQLQADLEAGAT